MEREATQHRKILSKSMMETATLRKPLGLVQIDFEPQNHHVPSLRITKKMNFICRN